MQDALFYAGPIAITLALVGLYYAFMVHGARVKARLARGYAARGEKFDRYFSQDREMLSADRIQLNLLEHMPPFLVLLWCNAVFVGTRSATVAGAIYVLARLAYPFLMGNRLGRSIQAKVLIATVPGYGVMLWFLGALIWALLR